LHDAVILLLVSLFVIVLFDDCKSDELEFCEFIKFVVDDDAAVFGSGGGGIDGGCIMLFIGGEFVDMDEVLERLLDEFEDVL
jgi:hypothetical protein